MPKETKANRAQSEARLNKVYDLLVSGLSRWQVWQYVTQNDKAKELFQGISRRQVDRYIGQASEMLVTEAEYHRPREFGRAIASLKTLYQAAFKIQDYKTALAVRKEYNALLALNEPPAAQTVIVEDMGKLVKLAKAKGITLSELVRDLMTIMMEMDTDEPNDA